ncbi:triple tyrosine motif-containing protein [soil metagenome]
MLIFLLTKFGFAYSQNPIGLPTIVNFARGDYNGGLQNRGIAQDENGIVYFANSEGLLSFDGVYWKRYPLPNQTIVRSVAIGSGHKIYVGGQNEMGYFSPDRTGSLVYTSLKSLLPEKYRSFKDIWDITAYNGQFFFRSQNNLFQYDGKAISISRPFSQWQFLGLCDRRLYAEDSQKGLLQFLKGKWIPVLTGNLPARNLGVTSLFHLNKDTILITTLKKGLFVLAGKQLSAFKFKGANPFKNQRLLCAIAMDDHHIAVGTQLGGLYIIDQNGRTLENLSRKEGLQNNTVLALFSDKEHNLWIGLDDGVDFYAYNSAIKHIYPEGLNEGTGYSAIVFNHSLYIGTSNWLYQLPFGRSGDLSTLSGTFKTVENTKGPVWGLFEVDHNLLAAHHEGAFQIKDNKAIPISTHAGYWNFIPYNSGSPSPGLMAGNYNGLDRLDYDGKNFISKGNINFNESSRFLLILQQTAWVANNDKGIFRVDLRSSPNRTRVYATLNGLPSLLKNRLFFIKNRMAVATSKGIYEYDERADSFKPSTYFKNIFGQKALRYLKEDSKGNVWFIEEKKLGVADFSGSWPRLIYFPELDGKLVSDFENIYPLNEENIFAGAARGFYHINYKKYKEIKNPVRVLIRAVKAWGDEDGILNGGYNVSRKTLQELSSGQNNLHFEYAAPSFQLQSNITYSYFLKGFDKDWSLWTKRPEKDYTNLPGGRYTFRVRARSNLGDESAITEYSFVVLPPWYRTLWAYAFYAMCFIAFNYLFYRWLKRKFRRQKLKYEQEQERLTYLHQLEMDQSEKEIIALKNEKLESEILGKNSELAAVAMHLLQKSELLSKIREELVHLRNSNNDMPSEELKKLIRIISQESKMDKDWEQFAGYFDTIQSDFLKAVKEMHPLLNPNELKLCAWLKMNLSSKEIAQLLTISVRGVEISRYRLRKKLGLPKEMNLSSYFTNLAAPKKDKV